MLSAQNVFLQAAARCAVCQLAREEGLISQFLGCKSCLRLKCP